MNFNTGKFCIALIAMLMFAGSALPATAAPEARLSDLVFDSIRSQARAEGLDAEAMLAAPAELRIHHADGTLETVPATLEESILRIVGETLVQPAGKGPAGTTEIVTGQFHHFAYSFRTGSARVYDIQTSSVPSTPSTPPTLVEPPAPLSPMYINDVGGPTYNVKGSYQVGYHSAGSFFPAASTAAEGPFLPQKDAGVYIFDNRIDFVGHANIWQTHSCFYNFCIGVGSMYASGVAQFDESPAEPVPSTAFPTLP